MEENRIVTFEFSIIKTSHYTLICILTRLSSFGGSASGTAPKICLCGFFLATDIHEQTKALDGRQMKPEISAKPHK